jgi:ribosomal protein S18 acetylase RimI-like enzyme
MAAILIRPAHPGDAPRLDQAMRDLSDALGDDHQATPEAIARGAFGENPSFHALVAEADGRFCGAALYSPLFSTVRGGAGVYVSDLWVEPEARSFGLGERLLGAVAEAAAARWQAGFMRLGVHPQNDGARRFYARLGFAGSDELYLTLGEAAFSALRKAPPAA